MIRTTIVCLFCLPYFSWTQNIVGSETTCQEKCEVYTIDSGEGGPYFWSATLSSLNSNMGDELTVCWSEAGMGTLSVIDLSADPGNNLLTLDVAVLPALESGIYFPDYPICFELDSVVPPDNPNVEFQPILCRTACEGSQVDYFVTNENPDNTYEWVISGAQNTTGNFANAISVHWNYAGVGRIKLIETNAAGCELITEYCIELIEKPDVIIDVTPNGSVCVDQPVYLDAVTNNASTYQWIYNDRVISDNQFFEFSFDTGGDHTLTLITNTECYCADTSYVTVAVDASPGPVIQCTGSTCVDAEQTYYAGGECNSYNWQVSSDGTVIDGGGSDDDFITVIWNSSPQGSITLSTSGCDGIVCSTPTTVLIPVIGPTAHIAGPDEVCKEGWSIFTAPFFPGTTYNWSLSGNGFISSGRGTHQITVYWNESVNAPNECTINLSYNNCLLECSGGGSKTITLKERFHLEGSSSACLNESGYITAGNPNQWISVVGDWEVKDENGVTVYIETNESYITFPDGVPNLNPGPYQIFLTENSGAYCNSVATAFIDLLPYPDTPLGIDGPLTVCAGEEYVYSALNNLPNDLFLRWKFIDNAEEIKEGLTVSHLWTGSGPYSIEVQAFNTTTGCSSEFLVLRVEEEVAPVLEGPSRACVYGLETYSLTESSTGIEWSIIPSDAGKIAILNDNEIQVNWLTSGNHTLIADGCGYNSFPIEVNSLPTFSMTHLPEICEGETTPITVTAGANDIVTIRDRNFNSFPADQEVGPGQYIVSVENPEGCIDEALVVIDAIPKPEVLISTPNERGFCPPESATLHAMDTEAGYTYEWFKDGVSLGETSSIITTTEYGQYQVVVTNLEGCTQLSNTIVLYEYCGPEYGNGNCNRPPCNRNGNIEFSYTTNNFCNVIQFTNISSPGHLESSLQYIFEDPIGTEVYNNTPDFEYVFPEVGFYEVILFGQVPSADDPNVYCLDYHVEIITVPIIANFYTFPSCVGEAVEFTNTSTFLTGSKIDSYDWNFGDPSSGSSNQSSAEHPTHTYSSEGSFLVTLTITETNGCISRIVQPVEILPEHVPDFNLPIVQCTDEGIFFEAISSPEIFKCNWRVDDPFSTAAENYVEGDAMIHTFMTAGSYDITLTCLDYNGCSSSITKQFVVSDQDLSGEISIAPGDKICKGETATLTAPTGGLAYLWSNGASTSSIDVSESGLYQVTVTNANGCNYEPSSVFIEVDQGPNTKIIGYSGDYYERHVERMEVCINEDFSLSTTFSSSTTFTWSTGKTGRRLYKNDLVALGIGEHIITVDAVVAGSNCVYTSDPFTLIIHDLPSAVQIASDQSVLCEGETHTISVSNPDPNLRYFWNTGQRGTYLTTTNPGTYYASAVNEFGCARTSNNITIHAKPAVELAHSGCLQTCFPNNICLPTVNNVANYEWLHNGVSLGPPSSSANLFVREAGDYQVIMTTWAGCSDISDVLTLEPVPSDHAVSGVAFLDVDGDGMMTSIDQPLSGVDVNLMLGNVSIDNTTTDASGEFLFVDIDYQHVSVEIDVSGLGYSGANVLQISFEECEDKEEAVFMFNDDCLPSYLPVDLFACEGELVEFDGQSFSAGDTQVFEYLDENNCDSIVEITVIELPLPMVAFSVSESCVDTDIGTLDITTSETFTYAIDGAAFSQDLNYGNLSAGPHTLTVQNSFGCEVEYNFDIPLFTEPLITLNPSGTCINDDSGSVEILWGSNEIYQFSIDSDPTLITTNVIYNLSAGMHTLFVYTAAGCVFPFDVTVPTVDPPAIDVTPQASCDDVDNGIVFITNNSGSNLMYNVDDNSSFLNQDQFDQLSVGMHTLWVIDENNCISSEIFEITALPDPSISFTVTSSCAGESTGILNVTPNTTGNYTLSVDGGPSQVNDFVFNDLSTGMHSLTIVDGNGCSNNFSFMVEEVEEPQIDFTVLNTCENESNGSLIINTVSANVTINIDGIGFSSQSSYDNLVEGPHYFIAMTDEGCEFRFDFSVAEFVVPIVDLSADEICPGASDGIININPNGNTIMTSVDGVTYDDVMQFTGYSAGMNSVYVQDENACKQELTILIEEAGALEVDFEEYVIDCTTESIEISPTVLNSTGSLSYSWSNGSTDESIVVRATDVYEVEISDECFDIIHEWDLEFVSIDPEESVFVPNIFSPSLDSPNDIFKPLAKRDIEIISYEFDVFDRWGNQVFSTLEFAQGWDGTHLQKDGEEGVYIWIFALEAELCGRPVSLNRVGDVTIIR